MTLRLYENSILQLKDWLLKQQPVLESILVDAATNWRADNGYSNFPFDCKMIAKEMKGLSQKADLCYDRPAVGLVYSLWYHAKRLNAFLEYYLQWILEAPTKTPIEIFDLGAGTGAVQWAVGLIYAAMDANGWTLPRFSIINIDSSPFMLNYNEQYLWKHFVIKYPAAEKLKIVYRLNSWTLEERIPAARIWISASYLFDHSENSLQAANGFEKHIQQWKPDRVLLLSATSKSDLVDKSAFAIKQMGYILKYINKENSASVFAGDLTMVISYRDELQAIADHGFDRIPTWNIDPFFGVILEKETKRSARIRLDQLKLYTPAEKERKKVQLTKEQEEASIPSNKPTLILGPAGCGKSVVLTQRLIRQVEQLDYDPQLCILVTTFNKKMLEVLYDWVTDLLDKGKARFKSPYIFLGDSTEPNILFFNLDKLPDVFGGIRHARFKNEAENYERTHLNLMAEAADIYKGQHNIDERKYAKIIDPHFLIEEYHRIIYGYQCKQRKRYLIQERIGRGNNPSLKYNSQRREIVWGIIHNYLSILVNRRLSNFVLQRQRMLEKLEKGSLPPLLDYVFVDEVQDCTLADYLIFQALLKNKDHLVMAGDLAQSIRLGGSAHFPLEGFEKIKLKGSFRLPFRISQALRPFSESINRRFKKNKASGEPDIIQPYKDAPPGARPIFVYARSEKLLARKLIEIYRQYSSFGLSSMQIFEEDSDLRWKIYYENKTPKYDYGHLSALESILKSKGLEMPCVVWSTRVKIDTRQELDEFVYTILTRTTSILIVAMTGDMIAEITSIVKRLTTDHSKVIYWDNETSFYINKMHQDVYPEEIDDNDDSEEVEFLEDDSIEGF